jgi:hypothetical protein
MIVIHVYRAFQGQHIRGLIALEYSQSEVSTTSRSASRPDLFEQSDVNEEEETDGKGV